MWELLAMFALPYVGMAIAALMLWFNTETRKG
jgi:hypothetical protein